MIVTLADYMSTPGCCAKGGRAFAAANGIDWTDFRRNGILAEDLERIDHALIRAVIETARRRLVDETGAST